MSTPVYACQDPYLSSFLLSQGASLVGQQRLGPKTVEFRFLSDERLHQLLRLYWSRQEILVVPARLFDALRQLKKRGGLHA